MKFKIVYVPKKLNFLEWIHILIFTLVMAKKIEENILFKIKK